MALFNPQEPVFDQSTGDLVIDPVTGDAVIVVEDAKYSDPVTGEVHDRDDVANAAYYRFHTYVGEVKRDQSVGVDFPNFVFANVGTDVAIAEISAALVRTPGVQSIRDVQLSEYNPFNRTIFLEYRLVKNNGASVTAAASLEE